MADSKVPKFDDTEPVFDETSPVEEPKFEDTVEAEGPRDSLANTITAKLAQGGTLGFDDEIAGALSGLGRAAGVEGLGGKLKDIKLSDAGPTLDPEALLAAYKATRDQTRATQAQMQEDRPGTSLAANVVGGIASVPAKLAAPLSAGKNASTLAKMGVGALNAAPTGAIAGLGLTEAELASANPQVAQALKDVGLSTALSSTMGGAFPLVGAGLSAGKKGASNLAGKLIPEEVKEAYALGKKGINTASQEFYDSVTDQLRNVVGKVAKPMTDKVEQAEAKAAAETLAAKQAKETAISQIDDQISQLQDEAKYATEVSLKKQAAQTADDINALNKESVDVAKNLQNQVYEVEKQLGKQFDEIDKAAAAAGIAPDSRDIISGIVENLQNNSSLTPGQIKAIQQKLAKSMGRTPQAYRDLKSIITGYFENADPVVRRTMKQAFGKLKNVYSNELRDNGYEDLANTLAETNKRWMAKLELEDSFLGSVKPSRVTGQIEADPKAIQTVNSFAEKTPGQVGKSDELASVLNVLDPKGAPAAIHSMDDVASRMLETKATKPLELPRGVDPKMEQLQALLKQAKAQALPEIPAPNQSLPLNSQNPQALKDKLTTLLPKQGQKTGDNVAENQLADIFNFLKENVGDDATQALKSEVDGVNRQLAVREAANAPAKIDAKRAGILGAVGAGAGSASGKILGGSVGLANKIGQKMAASEAAGGQTLLQKGVKALSDATPENLKLVAQKMAATGAQGAEYARVLSTAADKNSQSRNAIIFGLMQQPAFREMFKSVHEDGEDQK